MRTKLPFAGYVVAKVSVTGSHAFVPRPSAISVTLPAAAAFTESPLTARVSTPLWPGLALLRPP